MVTNDYNMTRTGLMWSGECMKSVNIATFKAELSHYLRFVRQGEEVVVLDRKEPMARVVPFKEPGAEELVVTQATKDAKTLFTLKPKIQTSIATDSLKFLLEERGDR